jgi:hypothetical protein
MRLSRSLLAIAAAATLAATTAFAEDSRPIEELALEEGDVIYIYPMEVTEYYLIVPDQSQING